MQNGLMGEAVFFYWLSRETHNALFEEKADGLLLEVIKKNKCKATVGHPYRSLGRVAWHLCIHAT